MKAKGVLTLLLALSVALAVVLLARPDPGQGAGRGNASVPQDEIEMGMFVNAPFSSPPWYPDECDENDDSYRWAPKCYWAVPSITVKVNPTASDFDSEHLDAVVTQVANGFDAWSEVPYQLYGAAVTRDDEVGPSLDYPDEANTVSWGEIDGEGGIIAVTYFWYYVNTKELIDCDILFDEDEPWSISDEVPDNAFDVWNIATHEAGHTLVLGDLRSPKTGALTMHAYTWPGDDVKRDLGLGDELGIWEIYGE